MTFNNVATTLGGVVPRIKGDGALPTSTYRTESGTTCQIYTGGSQDLTLNLHQSRSTPKRTLRYDYTQLADASMQPTANPPTGTLIDSSFMNIAEVGNVAVGATELRTAYFSTAIGTFEENPGRYDHSQLVVVTRTSPTTWTVSTDWLASEPGSGDLSIFYRAYRNTSVAVGLYHLPFELSVSCPACK
ncbi:MAG: hypothetical protein NTY02_10245 [Acidobacteria bacterium]|nr:hypothetical protein [Acidobacteriota bacterium]